MEYGLGIDLGTTHTAAAVRIDGRVEVVKLGNRRPEIPSVVFVRPDEGVLIGEAAERRGAAEPSRLAREFKRRIGDPVPILVGGAPYSAHALTARLLTEVLAIVTRHQDGPPAAVAVTHPANWGPYKRELLEQAIRLAELENVRFLTEPEAAALQYAAGERIQPGEIVAVYDLGGGTFDAAVLRKTATGFLLLGEPEGIEQLGGIDFDQAVFGHVMATLGSMAGQLDPDDEDTTAALTRLRRDSVEAKEALSFDTEVMVPVALPGLHTRVRLNRSEFESMIAPALADTIGAMRRALRSAAVAPEDLRAIVLAGGSSRIPLVGQLLGTEFGRPVVLDPHPEHAVALGAALVTGAPVAEEPTAPVTTVPVAAVPVVAAPVSAAAAPPAAAGEPPTVPTPKQRTRSLRLDRRALLIAVPALAVIGVTGGVVAGYLTSRPSVGTGPPPRGATSPPGRPGPSPTVTAGSELPAAPMLLRLDERGTWPVSSRSLIYSTAPGSGQRRLLAGSGFDILPQWSHDRRRIAFTRRQQSAWQVWTMNADGSQQKLAVDGIVGGTRVAWSPDDRRLAFMRAVNGVPQLFTVTVGRTDAVQLTNTREPKDDPAWAPHDANLIAIWRERGNLREIVLVRVDRPTAPWVQVTSGSRAADPAWSPDGRQIAYTRSGDIWLVNPDGSGNRALTSGSESDMDPSWSPDGGWVAFTRGALQEPLIYAIRPDGTGLRKVTVGNAREGHPGWS